MYVIAEMDLFSISCFNESIHSFITRSATWQTPLPSGESCYDAELEIYWLITRLMWPLGHLRYAAAIPCYS